MKNGRERMREITVTVEVNSIKIKYRLEKENGKRNKRKILN